MRDKRPLLAGAQVAPPSVDLKTPESLVAAQARMPLAGSKATQLIAPPVMPVVAGVHTAGVTSKAFDVAAVRSVAVAVSV